MIHLIINVAIYCLKDLGLKLPDDVEIDLLMAFALGAFLHIALCEVQGADTYL